MKWRCLDGNHAWHLHSSPKRPRGSSAVVTRSLRGPAHRLDATLAYLRGAGYTPFILVDDVEAPGSIERFSERSPFGRLDWRPLADVDGVTIYAVDGQGRP